MADRPGATQKLEAGVQIGSYRVEGFIASGSMGEIYRARHLGLGRTVALKVLQAHVAAQADVRRRFEIEAMATAKLRHPHILEVSDFGYVEGKAFLVMELLEGQTLDEHVREHGLFPPEEAVVLLDQLLSALSCAHAAGIVHRDLKPSNIFLCSSPRGGLHLKVFDFGLAKELDTGEKVTKIGDVLGTPAYMAPEQVVGREVDLRTDLYAVGCIAYELFTGAPPFGGSSPVEVMSAHLTQAPPPWDQARLGESPFEGWVRQALEKDPARRHESAEEMRLTLRALSAELAGQADADVLPAMRGERDTIPAPDSPRLPDETLVETGAQRRQGWRPRETRAPVDEDPGARKLVLVTVGFVVVAGIAVAVLLTR